MKVGWLSTALAATVGVTGALLALRDGGAREPRPAPPPVPADGRAPATARKTSAGGEAYEVSVRLIQALKDAKLDVPSLRPGLAAIDSHWRKMQPPWTGLAGTAAKLVTSYALLTSEEEKEYAVPLANGEIWKPDARQWNMAEGSFDQRESIFAPTPSTVGFRFTIPLHALLELSTMSENAPGLVAFTVRIVDARGERHDVWSRSLGKKDVKKWIDARIDLSEFGGQSVELELVTETRPDPARPDAPTALGIAMWGDPVLLTRQATEVPYNVLWIVVDATRADAIAALHDDAEDAAKHAAPLPPLEALLPKVPGVTPELDALARRGVRFTHAYSVASWTRPGTVAMLGGARSTELGLDALHWQLPDAEVTSFYAADPPLLPRLLRRHGVLTRAFVNNYFMIGYAAVGVDMGFEQISDYRYRTRDTAEITAHAVDWLKEHKDERFFVFCNYNSPHEPLDPPERFLARVPPPPAGPHDPEASRYLGEVAKDDEAIGVLLRTLDETGLRDHTIVVMTADHGETLSSAHTGLSGLDHMKVRYHHSASNYEETTHVPILLSLPGKLPEDAAVSAVTRTIDIAPTILDVEGLEASPKMSGRTLMHLVRGEPDGDPRVVLSEGRGTHGLLVGNYRLLTREGKAETLIFDGKTVNVPEELFDLSTDPGERKNIRRSQPEKAAEMRARLEAALHAAPVSGSSPPPPEKDDAIAVSLRFLGAGSAHRFSGTIWVDGDATLVVKPVGVAPELVKWTPSRADVSLATSPEASVGLDVEVRPHGAALHWAMYVDDQPLPGAKVFAGPFGLEAPSLAAGIVTDEARTLAFSPRPALLDPHRDMGMFVTRERGGEPAAVTGQRNTAGAASEEMRKIMKDWGYAHDKADLSR